MKKKRFAVENSLKTMLKNSKKRGLLKREKKALKDLLAEKVFFVRNSAWQ